MSDTEPNTSAPQDPVPEEEREKNEVKEDKATESDKEGEKEENAPAEEDGVEDGETKGDAGSEAIVSNGEKDDEKKEVVVKTPKEEKEKETAGIEESLPSEDIENAVESKENGDKDIEVESKNEEAAVDEAVESKEEKAASTVKTDCDEKASDSKQGEGNNDVETTEKSKEETEKEEADPPETPTPKKRRGRPPKNKTPSSAGAETPSAVKTPSSARSKRETPKSTSSVTFTYSTSKRVRQVAEVYSPSNFKSERLESKLHKVYTPGRGVQLSSLGKVKANINKKKNEPIVVALYKFIFSTMGLTGRGKPATKKMKASLMEFSGFLNADKEEEKRDVDIENEEKKLTEKEVKEKFESKAATCTDALLKSFCDILAIHRASNTNKKVKIEKLITFLAAPSESLMGTSQTTAVEEVIAKSAETRKRKGRPTKSGSSTPSKKKAKVPDDDDNDEVIDGKTIPSTKKLRTWVKAYVACFDLDKCNAKHAIGTASDKFKVDLDVKKNTIMEMLKEEIN